MTSKQFEQKQSFFEHLIELRACIIRALFAWLLAAVIVYFYTDQLLEFLIDPLRPYLSPNPKVYFKSLPEVFSIQIKLSAIMGFILGSPYIIYQLWIFVAPGLYPHEKRWAKRIIFISSFSFLSGVLVAFYIFLPAILKFFYSFGEKFLVFKPYLKEYISFLMKIFILFGSLFQIPSIIFVLNKLEIVNLRQLKAFRPYAVILSFFIASILTTSFDPINQILIALPLTLLYELGIVLIKISQFKGVKKCH